jgi:hypothetical protein
MSDFFAFVLLLMQETDNKSQNCASDFGIYSGQAIHRLLAEVGIWTKVYY